MSNYELTGYIYIIENLINGKYYIGSTYQLKRRQRLHFKELLERRHHSRKLQNAYNKYGKENFQFIILEKITGTNDDLRDKEQWYLDNCFGDYNISKSSRGGVIPSLKQETVDYILDMYITGKYTTKEIADTLDNVSHTLIRSITSGKQYSCYNICSEKLKKVKQVARNNNRKAGKKLSNSRIKVSQEMIDDVIKLFLSDNFTCNDLAKKHNVSTTVIFKILSSENYLGFQCVSKKDREEIETRHRQYTVKRQLDDKPTLRKLSDKQVGQIIWLMGKKTDKALSNYFNINKAVLFAIRNGITYKNITESIPCPELLNIIPDNPSSRSKPFDIKKRTYVPKSMRND